MPCSRHLTLTGIIIVTIFAIATGLLAAHSGSKDVSIDACCLALDIVCAFLGTNVALTIPGLIYYQIKKHSKSAEYSQFSVYDWVIIISLVGAGTLACISGTIKIFLPKDWLD
jgi:hypothetical protein